MTSARSARAPAHAARSAARSLAPARANAGVPRRWQWSRSPCAESPRHCLAPRAGARNRMRTTVARRTGHCR
ncbi:hypothetical protein, partial [Acinetobacter soli]|uniref:hypothetical protein n=1 Tax=Acinetobacter soli TaxID=487316 RepID=UPI0035A22FED